MSLVLSSEEELVAQSVRQLLARKAPVSAFRAVRDSGTPECCDLTLWSELISSGYAFPQIPEAYGGVGMGFMAAGLVAEEMGRTLAATPFHSAAMAAHILQSMSRTDELQSMLSGSLFSLAVDEGLRHEPHQCGSQLRQGTDGLRLTGEKRLVADGALARQFIVTAIRDDELCLVLIPADAPGVEVRPLALLDCRNAADINFNNVQVAADNMLAIGRKAEQCLTKTLDIGRILVSAELLGICQEVFERTIAYLKEREQFNVKIGSFQALQHRAAQLYIAIEIARAVALKAQRSLDEGVADTSALASLAKAKLTETSQSVTNEAILMHGGIGVTDELDIGLFFKRARVLGTWLGDDMFHLEALSRTVWKL